MSREKGVCGKSEMEVTIQTSDYGQFQRRMKHNKRVTLSFPAMRRLSHSSQSVRTREGEDEDGGTGSGGAVSLGNYF